MLRLKVDYAVCEKLCVPAQAKLELAVAGKTGPHDAALSAAEARVPRRVALGDGQTLSIRSLRRDAGSPRPRVVVEVAAPPGSDVDLFVEGPTAQWALPVPVAIAGAAAGGQRFAFDLEGAPPGAKYEGARITLTAVTGTDAIEVASRLD
jgi:DsbC/DsbD-like thiol-disulfide interchange protein